MICRICQKTLAPQGRRKQSMIEFVSDHMPMRKAVRLAVWVQEPERFLNKLCGNMMCCSHAECHGHDVKTLQMTEQRASAGYRLITMSCQLAEAAAHIFSGTANLFASVAVAVISLSQYSARIGQNNHHINETFRFLSGN